MESSWEGWTTHLAGMRAGRGVGDDPARTVVCGDAIPWLESRNFVLPPETDLITSLPDMSELPRGTSLAEWKVWFRNASRLCLAAVEEHRYSIFIQSDIKHRHADSTVIEWVDKAFLIQTEAAEMGLNLLWHRIELLDSLGSVRVARAGYSHVLCFSRTGRDPAHLTAVPDVGERGEVAWMRGVGMATIFRCVRFVHAVGARAVLDPFCGTGSTLAFANAAGLEALGVELSRKRCAAARSITVEGLRKTQQQQHTL